MLSEAKEHCMPFITGETTSVDTGTVIGSGHHSLHDIGYSLPWLPHLRKEKYRTSHKVCCHTVHIIKNDTCYLECFIEFILCQSSTQNAC